MCVTGGVEIPDHLINHDLDYLNDYRIEKELVKHLVLLLALHHDKLKEKFFELYNIKEQVNVGCLDKMEDDCILRITTEINEFLGIKPFKLTTIPSEV